MNIEVQFAILILRHRYTGGIADINSVIPVVVNVNIYALFFKNNSLRDFFLYHKITIVELIVRVLDSEIIFDRILISYQSRLVRCP